MKSRCAWHPKNFGFELDMGERPGPAELTTDSICEPCLEAQLSKASHLQERMQEVGMLLDKVGPSPLKSAVLNLADVVVDLIGEQVEVRQ